jgi:heme O synthase-like polyprenyltransferase
MGTAGIMGDLFQNKDYQEADAELFRARQREQRVNLKAFLLTIAIVMAPFLALLFGIEAALVVLAAGLAFTIWLTWMASNTSGPVQRSRLRAMAILNVVLFLVVVALLVGFLL